VCLVLGLKITDECSGETSTGIKNVLDDGKLTGKAEETFDSISREKPATCSIGGAGTGKIYGQDTIELKEGEGG
jgi:hypothetical protein